MFISLSEGVHCRPSRWRVKSSLRWSGFLDSSSVFGAGVAGSSEVSDAGDGVSDVTGRLERGVEGFGCVNGEAAFCRVGPVEVEEVVTLGDGV